MPFPKENSGERVLRRAYYDPGNVGSFGGIERLYRAVKSEGISRKQVARFLHGEDTYTLHAPVRRRFARQKTVVHGIDQQWQGDLVDVHTLARHNKGNRYILTMVDCFSRYAWAVPVKGKSGPDMREALRSLFDRKSGGRKPQRLQTDKGKEFYNAQVRQFLTGRKITLFSTESDMKAAIVERFNRTLKQRMWAWFTANNTRKYLNVLDDLLKGYNNSYHRSIGMTPTQASQKENEKHLWDRLYADYMATASGRLRRPIQLQPGIGSEVRISKLKTLFDKGYLPNWTEEVFTVRQAAKMPNPQTFRLEDASGEDIKGRFYRQEVQPISTNQSSSSSSASPNRGANYRIERVLSKRNIGRISEQWHVKWLGWPAKFNSWIYKRDIIAPQQ